MEVRERDNDLQEFSSAERDRRMNPSNKSEPRMLPVVAGQAVCPCSDANLAINGPLLAEWLVAFLKDEIVRRRGFSRAVVGISGGVDSSATAFLCARALGSENVF